MKSTAAGRAGRQSRDDDTAATYDAFKEFKGRRYTGMKVGRGHKWNYDPGVWQETKVTPDEWRIDFAVTKRRAGKAPEGSGVPVGTAYHWYILAHQNVTKVDANAYTTSMTGMKFKLAHRRADRGTWSASPQAQRRNLIRILKRVIEDLEREAAVEPHASTPSKARPGRTPRTRRRKLPLNGRRRAGQTKKTGKSRHSRAA